MAHLKQNSNIYENLRINEDQDFSDLGIDFFVTNEEVKKEYENKVRSSENAED